jgi:hypothetical protein
VRASPSSAINHLFDSVQPATTSRPLPERVTPRRPRRDVYEEARERLHAAAVPSSLPGREDEALEIEARLEAAIWERTGCCLCRYQCRLSSMYCVLTRVRYFWRTRHRKDSYGTRMYSSTTCKSRSKSKSFH